MQYAKKNLLPHILNSEKKQQKTMLKRHLWKWVTAVIRTTTAKLMSNGKGPFSICPCPSERHHCRLNCWDFKHSASYDTALLIHFQGNPLSKEFSLGFSWLETNQWKTKIHSCNFLILNTPSFGEMNNGILQVWTARDQMLLICIPTTPVLQFHDTV